MKQASEPDPARPRKHKSPGHDSHPTFPDAVADELRLLDHAPDVDQDGSRMQEEAERGATAETMSTASEVLDGISLRPELKDLQAATDKGVHVVEEPTTPA